MTTKNSFLTSRKLFFWRDNHVNAIVLLSNGDGYTVHVILSERLHT